MISSVFNSICYELGVLSSLHNSRFKTLKMADHTKTTLVVDLRLNTRLHLLLRDLHLNQCL